jgi:hypothetical protein
MVAPLPGPRTAWIQGESWDWATELVESKKCSRFLARTWWVIELARGGSPPTWLGGRRTTPGLLPFALAREGGCYRFATVFPKHESPSGR